MLDLFSQERVTRQYGEEMKKEGFKEGYKKGQLKAALFWMKKGKLTEEEAAGETGMTVKAFRKAAAALE